MIPLCDECHGPKAYFIEDGKNLCRHHASIPDEHRPALNALMQAGLIYTTTCPTVGQERRAR
jgi:hypothetical protein